MATPKQLSNIMLNIENKTLRQIINKLYYGKGQMSFHEAESKLKTLPHSSKDIMIDMIMADWEKRHPRPKDTKKQRNWEDCYDIILDNLSYELLGTVFN